MLVFSIVLLVLGVLCSHWFRSQPAWSIILEGYVAVFVGGVILLELLPHCVEALGPSAVIWVVLGLAIMAISEIWAGRFNAISENGRKMESALRSLALICGFGVHALADGAALAVGELHDAVISSGGEMLVLAVVAHRLPIGIALGLLMDNLRTLYIVTGVLVLCTVLGYFSTYLAQHHLSALSDLAVLQAVACGSLMHVVFGHPINEQVIPRFRALGAFASMVCLVFLLFTSGHSHSPLVNGVGSTSIQEQAQALDHERGSSSPPVDHVHSHHSSTEHTTAPVAFSDRSSSRLKLLWWLFSFGLLAVLAIRPLRILCFGEHHLPQQNPETSTYGRE